MPTPPRADTHTCADEDDSAVKNSAALFAGNFVVDLDLFGNLLHLTAIEGSAA